ncbi:MAG: polyisoprenyl-teichoic acid--peptidoglycan teichoic acid transferase [Gaiellaceae bacterium]|nr:polyisoprenyl-teichoic acid--peptidoglycan teichoic acid transferase [Gaiellaceae bacterium]
MISTPDGSGPVRPSMRIYRAENVKEPKKRRRVLRFFLWTFLVLGLVTATGAGAFYFYLRNAVDQITEAKTPDEKGAAASLQDPSISTSLPSAKRPVIFLLIGQDRRPGEARGRSDTLMLVRVDPKTKTVSMLSFPRDWIVNIPGHGPQEITNSYILGGPKLTIDTIRSVTGITPNYYVSVDFDAFTQTVNAFNGAYVEVDRRYFNLNQNTAGTNFNSIDIQPGYQLMRGQQALEYVRHRHDDDDTYRLARQQLFLREFKVKLDPISIGRNLTTLLDTAKKNLKIIGKKQMGIGDMELYANTLRAIPKNNMINVRFVGHGHPTLAGRISVDQSEIDATVEQFLDPDPSQAARAADEAAGKVKKTSTKYDAATIQVEVRNGNGKVGAAADLETQLVRRGWKNARAHGDAENSEYFDSVIYYGTKPGSKEAATALKAIVNPSEIKPLDAGEIAALNASVASPDDPNSQVYADVVVVVGQTFDTLAPEKVKALPADVKARIATDRTRDLARWKRAQKSIGRTIMYPTKLPNDTITGDPQIKSYDAFRRYKLRGKNALHVTYYEQSQPAKSTFGVQVLDWETPPLLQSPNETRTQNNIEYLLYFNGAKLHRVAWHWNKRTYWLSNSIVDGLSNSTMWAIATSFRRIPS